MECSPPRMSLEEAVFGMYVNNIYCDISGLSSFMSENNEGKRKKILDDFKRSVRKILSNKKALSRSSEGEYVSLDEKELRLQQFCDEIVNILFDCKKDLKEMKIKDDSDYLLFLDQIFDFFLSEKNLPSFINLIFSLVSGGSIFTKEGDYEKDREWLGSFQFKI